MPVITSSIVEFKILGQITEPGGGTKKTANVFHYASAVPLSNFPDLTTPVDTFRIQIVNSLLPLLHDDYSTTEITGRWLDQHSFPEVVQVSASPGAKTGDRLPAYCAVCIQLKSALRGRSFNGSKHLGPIAENDTTQDQLIPTVVAAWKTFATILTSSFASQTLSLVPVILSRKMSQLNKDPIALSAAAVTGSLLNVTLGTLRKRKEKTVIG